MNKLCVLLISIGMITACVALGDTVEIFLEVAHAVVIQTWRRTPTHAA